MSVGDSIQRVGSVATIAELAQRVEQMERFLSGGIGPVDLMGSPSHNAADLGGPAQIWRRLYAGGLTIGATDIDLTTVAQQLAAASAVIYTAAGDHDATTDITALRFLVLGAGAQGGGGGGGGGGVGGFADREPGHPGHNGALAPLGGAIVTRTQPTDSIIVTVGAGGSWGSPARPPSIRAGSERAACPAGIR